MPPELPTDIEMISFSPEGETLSMSFLLKDTIRNSRDFLDLEEAVGSVLSRKNIAAVFDLSVDPESNQLTIEVKAEQGSGLDDDDERLLLSSEIWSDLNDLGVIESFDVPSDLVEVESADEDMPFEVPSVLAEEEGTKEYTMAFALLPTEANIRKAKRAIDAYLSENEDRQHQFLDYSEGAERAGQEVMVRVITDDPESDDEQLELASELWQYLYYNAGVQFTAKPEEKVDADYSLYAKVDAHPSTELSQLEALSRNVRVHAETLESLIGLDFDAPMGEALFEAQSRYFQGHTNQSIDVGMRHIESELVRLRSEALDDRELEGLKEALNHSFGYRLSVLAHLAEEVNRVNDSAVLKARLWVLLRLTGMSLLTSLQEVQQVSSLKTSVASQWRDQLTQLMQRLRDQDIAVDWMPNTMTRGQWNHLVLRGISLEKLEEKVQKIVIEAPTDITEAVLQKKVNQCIDHHVRLQSGHRSEQPFEAQINFILGDMTSEYAQDDQQMEGLKKALDLDNMMHEEAAVIVEGLRYFEAEGIGFQQLQPLIRSMMVQVASDELEAIQRKQAILISKPYRKLDDFSRDVRRLTAMYNDVRAPLYLRLFSSQAYQSRWCDQRRNALNAQLSHRTQEFNTLKQKCDQLNNEIISLEHKALVKTLDSLCTRIKNEELDIRLSVSPDVPTKSAVANYLQAERDNFDVLSTAQNTVMSRMLKSERYVHVSEISGLSLQQQNELLEQKRLGREQLNRLLAPETLLSQYLTALGVLDANKERRAQQLRLFTRGITRTQDLIQKLIVLNQSLERMEQSGVDVLHIANDLYENKARPGFLARAGHRLQGYGLFAGASGIAGLSAALATHHHPGLFVAGAALAGAVLKGVIDAKGQSIEVESRSEDDLMGVDHRLPPKTQVYETTDVWVELNSDGSISKYSDDGHAVPVSVWRENEEGGRSLGEHNELKHASSRFSDSTDEALFAELFEEGSDNDDDISLPRARRTAVQRRASTDSNVSGVLEEDDNALSPD